MKKIVIRTSIGVLFFLICSSFLFSQSVGGGISFFIPETLYRDKDGTIAFEQGLSTSVGIGSLISIPIGFFYHSSDGYQVSHLTGPSQSQTISGPSLYGDIIAPYIQLKARVPLGPLYIEAWGGGLAAHAFSLKPTANFAKLFGENVAVDEVTLEKSIGYGWLAGGALGIQIDAIGIDIGVTYRSIEIPISGSATYGIDNDTVVSNFHETAVAVLNGISIRIGGSFSF